MYNSNAAPMVQITNQVQQTGVVLKTKDLSIFKQIKGNRPPNPQHIKRLADSIRTYGILCNPILVNEKMEVIDGQHRLLAAQQAGSDIYYVIIKGYSLTEVHALNLNQKNWQTKDFLDGYADMGIDSYVKLKKFAEINNDFLINDCILFCSNISGSNAYTMSQKYNKTKNNLNMKEVFAEGTWKGKDFSFGQEMADKIRLIKPYYRGYNRSVFVKTMISLFLYNKNFDFNEFMHKLRLQPTALVDCTNISNYKSLIEDIYNYRSRNKVNLRFAD